MAGASASVVPGHTEFAQGCDGPASDPDGVVAPSMLFLTPSVGEWIIVVVQGESRSKS
jgi:hypothetical protein